VGISQALERLPLTVFPSRVLLEAALEVALRTGRTVYDSLYLALAVALECRLVTADERLANAMAGGPLARHVVWVGAPGGY
jgi:predicted nucleic acid-binding protein